MFIFIIFQFVIHKQQIRSALTQVIHPNFGKDLITLKMIWDIVVQEKFVAFTLEMADENPTLATKLRDLCENAIYKYVDEDAVLDIQIETNVFRQNEIEKEETEDMEQGANPMNMEEATAENFVPPATIEKVPYEKMPEIIKTFMDEHQKYLQELETFEEALIRFKKQRWQMDDKMNKTFSRFFTFLDNHILEHNRREENSLFPLLKKRFLETGEHSRYFQYMEEGNPRNAIDVMEDEHTQLIQLSTLTFNFLGLAQKLPDVGSQSIVSDLAFEQGRQIVETLRLHIKREDETLFPLACQLIEREEFEQMKNAM